MSFRPSRRTRLLWPAIAWLLLSSTLAASSPFDALPVRLAERIRKNRAQNAEASDLGWTAHLPPEIVARTNLHYLEVPGVEPRLNSMDVYHSREAGKGHPIVMFVHGGGMSAGDKAPAALVENKARFFPAHGFVFVSVNYRLAPEVRDPVATRDVAAAVAYVRRCAREWGGDPDAIFLIGHSAGAQIVVQFVTDRSLLAEAGIPAGAIQGAVVIDTALYDIPYAVAHPDDDGLQREIVEMTYGPSLAAWESASPINRFILGQTLPRLLLFHATDPNSLSCRATWRFADKARAAGVSVTVESARDKDHSHLGRDLGNEGDWITDVAMGFLRPAR